MRTGGFIQALLPTIIDTVKEPAQRLIKSGVDKLVDVLTGKNDERLKMEQEMIEKARKQQQENKEAMDAINKKAREFVMPTQTRSGNRKAPGRSALLTPEMESKQMEMKKGEGMNLKNSGDNTLASSMSKYGLANQTAVGIDGGLLFSPGMRRRGMVGCGTKNFEKFNQSPISQANTYGPLVPEKITHQMGSLKRGKGLPSSGMVSLGGLLTPPNQGGLLYNPNASR
jgi:hypothetical protein